MSFFNARNFVPPSPVSMEAEITKVQLLYQDIADKIEASRKSIHACCTSLERWRQRIQHFKARYTKEQMKHASTRNAYDDMQQVHRTLMAQKAFINGVVPAARDQFNGNVQAENQKAPSTCNLHADRDQHQIIWPSSNSESERETNHWLSPVHHVQNTLEVQQRSTLRSRKRKRSDSDQ